MIPGHGAGGPLRVLMMTGSFPPMKCGVGDYTASLVQALAALDEIDVGVLTDEEAGTCGERAEVLRATRGWRWRDRSRLLAAVSAWRPDIVHVQYPTQGYARRWLPFILPPLLAWRGHAIVLTWHEYVTVPIPRYLPNAFLRGGLIAVRPRYLENLPWYLRRVIKRKEFRFIPNASSIPAVILSDDERRAIREDFATGDRRLVLSFGFAYPAKGMERLFDLLDPEREQLIVATDLRDDDPYHRLLLEQLRSSRWRDRSRVIGFQAAGDLARIIAASDAVVLPFRDGGGGWNTSLHAVASQGTFAVTTSEDRRGYDAQTNTYYAPRDGLTEMRAAIDEYAGRRLPPRIGADPWQEIAAAHVELYRAVLARSSRD